jgi:hypothetical protein
MAESQLHMDLVRQIALYVKEFTPNFSASLIDAELPEYGRTPQVINGFYPDLRYRDKDIIIIGEAKTKYDIDNEHTQAQLNAYIDEILTYNLQRHIIYCVPFISYAKMKNVLRLVKKQRKLTDLTFHVLDNFKRVANI